VGFTLIASMGTFFFCNCSSIPFSSEGNKKSKALYEEINLLKERKRTGKKFVLKKEEEGVPFPFD